MAWWRARRNPPPEPRKTRWTQAEIEAIRVEVRLRHLALFNAHNWTYAHEPLNEALHGVLLQRGVSPGVAEVLEAKALFCAAVEVCDADDPATGAWASYPGIGR